MKENCNFLYMKTLNERYNLVKKDNERWDRLVDVITEYFYDAQGLNNDAEILIDDPVITLSVFKQFYMNIHNTFRFPDDIIPSWIKKFSIIIDEKETGNAGHLKLNTVEYDKETEKLSFSIGVNFDWSQPNTLKACIYAGT